MTEPRRALRRARRVERPGRPAAWVGLVLWTLAIATQSGPPRARAQADRGTTVAAGVSVEDFHAPDEQLRGLISRLLAHNPRVGSAWARSRSSFERVPQERALPDPRLTYRYFARPPETRVGPQDHALEISQGLPWKRKRELQGLRAESVAAATTWEAEQTQRRLVARLKTAYFEAAYVQEGLRVNGEELELLRRFERIALRRYSTGGGIQQSVVKVQTEISRLEEREFALQERLDAVARRISELIGAPEESLTLAPIALIPPRVDHEREGLEEAAVSGHPSVRALERRVEADRAWASRRKLEGRPDFHVGIGYTLVGDREDLTGRSNPPADNGQDVLALTVGVDVPIFRKRIRAGVAEALRSERANEMALESTRDGLRFEVQQASLRARSLDERGRLFREVIIPQAEESLASAEAAYTTDRLGFLDLLDAQRVLFQSRLAYHRLVSDLWIALTDLERSAGTPVPAPGPSATGETAVRDTP